MASIPFQYALFVAAVLFSLGLIGVLARRDLIFVMMSIEIMLNAVMLAFVVAGARWGQPDGQIMYILVLTAAGGAVAVGLALMLQIRHRFRTLDLDAVSDMRG